MPPPRHGGAEFGFAAAAAAAPAPDNTARQIMRKRLREGALDDKEIELELAETRADLLAQIFPAFAVTRFDAAQIDDHLAPDAVPSVVLMNPPFSVMANVSGRVADAAYRHVAAALARLAPRGRLVTITGAAATSSRLTARIRSRMSDWFIAARVMT